MRIGASEFTIEVQYLLQEVLQWDKNIDISTWKSGMLKAIDAAAKRRKLTLSAFRAQAARNELADHYLSPTLKPVPCFEKLDFRLTPEAKRLHFLTWHLQAMMR